MNIEYFSSDYIMNFGMVLFFLVFSMLITILIVTIKSFFTRPNNSKFEPNISIIVPAYNEEHSIAECLKAIFAAKYDKNKLEIIVVDDGSTDKTLQIVNKFKAKHNNLKIIKGIHKGKSEALNLGVKQAKHDFILTIDSDTIINKEFIKEIIKPFSNELVGATNGIAKIHAPTRIIEHFQNVEYYFNNLIRHSFSSVFNNGIWFFGAAACFRKEVIKKAGFFSKKVLTEDMEMSLKIFEMNYQVLTVKNSVYHTRSCHTIKELFEQRMRWFYGGLQCIYKHKKLFRRKTFAIKYLFFSQLFWSIFSILVIPLVIYEVNFWLPNTGIVVYLFRWFSLAGPFYVLYKMPDWGLSLINIFGVMAGIITMFLMLIAIKRFNGKLDLKKLTVIFFYFPYTLLLNAILSVALLRYAFTNKKHFVK